VTRMQPLLQRGWALLLLPLSVLPFVMLGPRIAASHRNFDRTHKSGPLAAPPVVPSPAELARWRPLAPYPGAVPVIAYPSVGSNRGLTRAAFARQMEMLQRAGFHAISVQQYARFRGGLPAGLPSRPLLITFDGGRLDSFRSADRVLQRHGFRATMFVVSGEVERRNPDYLTWRELLAMERSGRWDVQPQAADGDRLVAVDPSGTPGEFYAYRRYTRSAGKETFAAWQERVTRDLFDARDAMVAQGFDPVSFAVPHGNYGQHGSNDPRIAPYMRSLLASQFGIAFVANERNDPPYTTRAGDPARYEIHAGTTADDLYAWLRSADPAERRR
jgi:hypothetical protein